MSDPIFPPLTLDAGRAEWTPRDKLARLVEVSRAVGWDDATSHNRDEAAEERTLFAELAALLSQGDEAICEQEDWEGYVRVLQADRDEALGRVRSLQEEADTLAEERSEALKAMRAEQDRGLVEFARYKQHREVLVSEVAALKHRLHIAEFSG
jgi:chromosome segregation ATPase